MVGLTRIRRGRAEVPLRPLLKSNAPAFDESGHGWSLVLEIPPPQDAIQDVIGQSRSIGSSRLTPALSQTGLTSFDWV